MSTIVTRAGKGSPLTNTELDSNFTNLNTDKAELSGSTFTGNLSLGDNVKAQFGADNDLQIFHTGTESVIHDSGTGNLDIKADSLSLLNAAGSEYYARFYTNGAANLYHNGILKINTTSTGIDVTGSVTSTGLNIDTTDPFMSFKESGATKLFIGESSVVGGGGAGFYDFYAVAGLGQRFFTGAAERIRIFSGGNTSIGSSTDLGYKLNVVGNALFRTDSAATSFGNHSSSIRIQNKNTTDNNYAGIVFDGSTNAAGAIQFQYTDQSGSYGDICFETRGSGGYAERLRIGSSGSSTFSGSVTSTSSNIIAGTGTDAIQTFRVGSGNSGANKASINFQNSASNEIFSLDFNNSTGTFDINGDLGGTALSITRAGASTFSGSVTAPTIKSTSYYEGTSYRIYNSTLSNYGRLTADSLGSVIMHTGAGEGARLTPTGLGIGTQVPTSRLHLKSASRGSIALRVTDSDTTNDILRSGSQPDGDGFLQLRTVGGAGNVLFDASGDSYVNGGNLGIGTDSPSATLDVENSSGAMVMVDDTNGRFIKIRSANSGSQNANISSYAGLYLGGSDNASHMLISNTGNVNIGSSLMVGSTTAPSGKLHIKNGASGATYTPDGADQVILENNDSMIIDIRTPSGNSGGILFSDNDARGRGFVLYSHSNDTMYINTAGASALTLDSSQNATFSGAVTSTGLTLSTTYPKLQLNSTSGVPRNFSVGTNNETFTIRNETASSDSLTISNANIVNIPQSLMVGSTTAPSAPLHILGNSSLQTAVAKIVRQQASASNNTYTFELDSSAHVSNMTSGGAMAVDVNSGRAFTINGLGNVGIGTSSPSAKLQVQGGTSGLDQISISSNTTANTTKYAGIIMTNYANTTTALLGAKAENGTSSVFYGSSGSDHRGIQNHIFYTNASATATSGNTERMRLNADGSCRWTPDGTTHDMTLTASGDLLVGKTSVDVATSGTCLRGNVSSIFTVSGSVDTQVAIFNRTSLDGTILDFRKDGTSVGSIGVSNFDLTIQSSASGHNGLRFGDAWIAPIATNQALDDGTTDLGLSGARFKDIFLSGTANASELLVQKDIAGSPTRIKISNNGTVQSGTAIRLSFYEGTSEKSYIERRRDGSGKTAFVTPADDNPFVFESSGSLGEFARFTSGNLLVGKTAVSTNTAGFEARSTGFIGVTRADVGAYFTRLTTDGEIIQFRKDTTTKGNISVSAYGIGFGGGTRSSDFFIKTDGTASFAETVSAPSVGKNKIGLQFVTYSDSIGAIKPYSITNTTTSDDKIDLGESNARFNDIYATNGTIQTSDQNEKQDIESLTEAEERVAVACKGLLKKFRWKSAVEEKGDDARIHFGIIAQDLQAAFEAEGLDAGRYGMFTSNTWTEDGVEKTRMGVRYSELLAFIISAI